MRPNLRPVPVFSGRLPYTIYPKEFVFTTLMSEHDLSKDCGRTHRYYKDKPLRPFGFGLSLSDFRAIVQPASATVTTTGTQNQTVAVHVTNIGPLTGDVVLIALLVPVTLPLQPGHPLKQRMLNFTRVASLPAGASMEVYFELSPDSMSLVDLDTGDLVATPGTYTVVFDTGKMDYSTNMTVTMTGPQRVLEPFPLTIPTLAVPKG